MNLKNIFPLILAMLLLYSCRKDMSVTESPSAKLEFSTDTVLFDTVFTTVGSTFRRLKVYNRNEQAVKISSINLAGGKTSSYKINVDGFSGPTVSDYELAGKDSMFIFVRVTIEPNSSNTPFIVSDSILFNTNGNRQQVQLAAYGQKAHFYHDSILPPNTVWDNDLPHVVYGYVGVDSTNSLRIKKGTHIHFHKRSQLLVLGTLTVQGKLHDSVIFEGDRLESIYSDEPGQWNGIHFLRGSVNNRLDYALIKNAILGIRVDSLPVDGSSNPNLVLNNCIMKHITIAALVSFSARVEVYNSLIFDCGQFGIFGSLGGEYKIAHCTIGNFNTNFDRKTPSLVLVDYYKVSETEYLYGDRLLVSLRDNIIWGSLEDEFLIQGLKVTPSLDFSHNLLRTKSSFDSTNVINKDPLFVDYYKENYHLTELSPAKAKGAFFPDMDPSIDRTNLDGGIRQDPPDIGCY